MSSKSKPPFNAIPIKEIMKQAEQPQPPTILVLNAETIRQAIDQQSKSILHCAECAAKGWKKCHHRYIKCLDCRTAMKIFICFADDASRCDKYGASTHTHITCVDEGCKKLVLEGKVDFKTHKDQYVPGRVR